MQEMTRSARLRKYEIAYEECIKKINFTKVQPLKNSRSRRCKLLLEAQPQPLKKSRSRRCKILIEVQPQPIKKSRSRSRKQLFPVDDSNFKKNL
jgi:hypothetical protein